MRRLDWLLKIIHITEVFKDKFWSESLSYYNKWHRHSVYRGRYFLGWCYPDILLVEVVDMYLFPFRVIEDRFTEGTKSDKKSFKAELIFCFSYKERVSMSELGGLGWQKKRRVRL